jgi:hypothetical protein
VAKTLNDDATGTVAENTAISRRMFSPLDRARQQQRLRDLKGLSFEELAQQATSEGTRVVDASEAGIGFRVVERKDKIHLVGEPLVVLPGWQVNRDPATQRLFVSAYVKTQRAIPQLGGGSDFIVNDGSTGIAAQLKDIRARCEAAGEEDPMVVCRRGLKRSTYTITEDLVDEKTGEVVIDPETRKPVQVPRKDPVTDQPLGEGETYYLDESS